MFNTLLNSASQFDRRLLVVGLFGAILFLSTWLSTFRDRSSSQPQTQRPRRAAPAFRLFDQNSELVNLSAFLNRHRLIVAFFDGRTSPADDSVVQLLVENSEELLAADYQVFLVSMALPQENRARVGDDFPFALLSDPAAIDSNSAHRMWGCLRPPDARIQQPTTIPKLFVVDRLGRVAWDGQHPSAEQTHDDFVARLLAQEILNLAGR